MELSVLMGFGRVQGMVPDLDFVDLIIFGIPVFNGPQAVIQ